MSDKAIAFLVFLSCYLTPNFCHAQDSGIDLFVHGAITTPILDNGTGFSLGLNPSKDLNRFIKAEMQINYNYTTISSSFVSGRTGSVNSGNVLVGGRLSFMPSEKPNRIYVNALIGANLSREMKDGLETQDDLLFGLSSGVYVKLKQFAVGAGVEAPAYFFVRAGYTF